MDGLGRGGCWILIVRAEPADEAALFLGGALVVEFDEAGEEFLFNLGSLLGDDFLKITGSSVEDSDDVGGPVIEVAFGQIIKGAVEIAPPIRFQYGGIQLVVDLPQHGDEALVVDELFLGGERLAAAELF